VGVGIHICPYPKIYPTLQGGSITLSLGRLERRIPYEYFDDRLPQVKRRTAFGQDGQIHVVAFLSPVQRAKEIG